MKYTNILSYIMGVYNDNVWAYIIWFIIIEYDLLSVNYMDL